VYKEPRGQKQYPEAHALKDENMRYQSTDQAKTIGYGFAVFSEVSRKKVSNDTLVCLPGEKIADAGRESENRKAQGGQRENTSQAAVSQKREAKTLRSFSDDFFSFIIDFNLSFTDI
jgi:hypothetical protein